MNALATDLRNSLEATVVFARDAAERAVRDAMQRLGVLESSPHGSLSDEERVLRRALRAEARRLGGSEAQGFDLLVSEGAYEHWHRMLFARFLAENELLIHPDYLQPVSLEDCRELAPHEGDPDAWTTAARYASRMLPGIFHQGDPLLALRLAPEGRRALERLLEGIPRAVFVSSDGLGWVYQFWQTKAKREVNHSGRKIGGADISPVTQLFTEHYMVQFLLHNTLGAWWTARHPETPLPTDKSYLRFVNPPGLTATPLDKGESPRPSATPLDKGGQGGIPAAGSFEGWPEAARDLTVMDPCCGSGHFLVAAFALLKRFRMIEEGLSEAEAGDAVLHDNLHGLEIDPRCTQLAAFNLALEAWKSGGYRELPPMNIACSGVSVGSQEGEWTALAGDDPRLAKALSRLYGLFKNAPDLGSLIDPTKLDDKDHLYTARFEEVEGLLEEALKREKAQDDPVAAVFGEAAKGLSKAARLLRGKYHLVITNVPYLARGKQSDTLKDYIERSYPLGKADLATAFVERCRDFSQKGGTYALVTPQNWLFLGSYKGLRELLLQSQSWNTVARLGPKGFQTPMWDFNVMLSILTNARPAPDHIMTGLDVSEKKTPAEKEQGLLDREVKGLEQAEQLSNPDARVVFEQISQDELLADYVSVNYGSKPGQTPRVIRFFWEVSEICLDDWVPMESTPDGSADFTGKSQIAMSLRFIESEAIMEFGLRSADVWGRQGVVLSQMRSLPCSIYTGHFFDNNTSVIIPYAIAHLPAVYSFMSSDQFPKEVRKQNQKLDVDTRSMINVPFDLEHWQKVAAEKYPNGLPEPYSNDPTQWLFNGAITEATEPLQVAVARLLGYSWPEQGKSMGAHPFPESETDLGALQDEDGVVCLPAVAGELPAAERLRALLARAYGERWSAARQAELLAGVGFGGKDLGEWLRDGFFAQHCRLFNNRPFVWHVWDGRKDGFSALVNYHKLGGAKLDKLIYTYLASYIMQQEAAAKGEERGADLRLAAAKDLKAKLEAVRAGEPPYDIFVRWKALREQPIGWEPDVNDGVRLNIRPFVTAGVLRSKFTINWNKDRGTDPKPNASGTTERLNDLHLSLEDKRKARVQNAAD